MKSYIKIRYPNLWSKLRKLRYPNDQIPLGLWVLNLIVQRVFRINGNVPWMVHFTSTVISPHNIEIGERVWISFAVSGCCYIQGGCGIFIGDRTIFAPGVKIISANHDRNDLSKWTETESICIGNDCWLGANSVILPGVKLGDHCVVGAGAVVTHDFPNKSVLVGVPAVDIANR